MMSLYLSSSNSLYQPFILAVKNCGYSVMNAGITLCSNIVCNSCGRWKKNTDHGVLPFIEHLPGRKLLSYFLVPLLRLLVFCYCTKAITQHTTKAAQRLAV